MALLFPPNVPFGYPPPPHIIHPWNNTRPIPPFLGVERRPRAIWYSNFHNLGPPNNPIRVGRSAEASRRLADRNKAYSNIVYDPHLVATNRPPRRCTRLNLLQTYFLRRNPRCDLGPRISNDIDVYNHACYELCRDPGNAFIFADMRDLYYFLLHMERRGARQFLRHIIIENMTDGTCVELACRLLQETAAELVTLELHHCPTCAEQHCPPRKWKAWQALHGFVNLAPPPFVAGAAVPLNPQLTIVAGPFLDSRSCEGCQARMARGLPDATFKQLVRGLTKLQSLRRSLAR